MNASASPRSLPRLGVTLYSLTSELHLGRLSLESALQRLRELGVGPGLEIIGFQSVRGFPAVDAEFALELRRLADRHEFELSCLDVHQDVGIRRDRLMSDDELADHVCAQIDAAETLGFPILRLMPHTYPVIERVLTRAEAAEVTLAIDIHAPHTVHHPDIQRLLELYERLDSQRLGFIPDLSSSSRAIPPMVLNAFLERGMSEAMVSMISDTWNSEGDQFAKQILLERRVRELGGTDAEVSAAMGTLIHFGSQPPEDWAILGSWIVHLHAKCFEFDDSGSEIAVPYESLLPLFAGHGYEGWISTGYEGFNWVSRDGFQMVADHHALCRRILSKLATDRGDVSV